MAGPSSKSDLGNSFSPSDSTGSQLPLSGLSSERESQAGTQAAYPESSVSPPAEDLKWESPVEDAVPERTIRAARSAKPATSAKPVPSAKPGAAPLQIHLAGATNDDPWSDSLKDKLGAETDARAFARLVAANTFVPPLAVGIFGQWGAGKSFFMRLVHKNVAALAEEEQVRLKAKQPRGEYFSNIVQIRFNAWHYVETNLWASLVDHLFTELGKGLADKEKKPSLLAQLGTARLLTLEAAEDLAAKRKACAVARTALDQANQNLAQKEQSLKSDPQLYADALVDVLTNDPGVNEERQRLETELRALGMGELQKEGQSAVEAWVRLDREVSGGGVLVRGLAARLGQYWWLAAGALLVAPLLVVLALKLIALPGALPEGGLPAVVAAFSTALATGTALLGKATALVQQGVTRLQTAKRALDDSAELKLKAARSRRTAQEAEVTRASDDLNEAKNIFELSRQRLTEAEQDFNSSTGAGRLIKFIRARATDGHYASHLGLVASVRRDMEELALGAVDEKKKKDEKLKKDGEQKEDEERRPAFKAARKAMEARIAALEADGGLEASEAESLRAQLTPEQPPAAPFERLILYIDDLDRCPSSKVVEVLQAVHMLLAFKLFVVFVAVDVRWVSHALKEQHPGLMSGATDTLASQASPADYLEKIFQLPYWVRPICEGAGPALLRTFLPMKGGGTAPQDDPPNAAAEVSLKQVDVTHKEAQMLEAMLPYVAESPRKVLWFANVYRLLKANEAYSQQLDKRGASNLALISQLALVSFAPRDFETWIAHLADLPDELPIPLVVSQLKSSMHPEHESFWEALERGLHSVLSSSDGGGLSLSELRFFAEVARRHSFSMAENQVEAQVRAVTT